LTRFSRLAVYPHNERMGSSTPKTTFEPVRLEAAPKWYVRIALPHGEDIHIDELKTEAEARAWIDDKSAARLKKYRGADMPKTIPSKSQIQTHGLAHQVR
jgi:hypothetical protein